MNLLIRFVQILLGAAGLLIGGYVSANVFGEGYPTVIGAWAFAFTLPYVTTRIVVRLLSGVRQQRPKQELL